MSDADRQKWQRRYRDGAYVNRAHPSTYLVDVLRTYKPSVSKALDLACGAGRNAMYLASQGFRVDAVDIAGEALRRGRETAQSSQPGGVVEGLQWIEWDLDQGLPTGLSDYGLIIMTRYLDVALLRSAAMRLLPGGYLLAEVHLQTEESVAGPSGKRFRAAPGELKAAVCGLDVIEYAEGLFEDPDGSTVALARLLAKSSTRAPVSQYGSN